MGDRVSTVIEIGGEVAASDLAELIEAIEGDHLSFDWGCGPAVTDAELRAAAARGDTLYLTAHEVNYAELEGVEGFCLEHGLAYRKQWDQGGEYGAGGELWMPGQPGREYAAADTSSEPLLPASTIRQLGSWEAVNAHLAELMQALPPFKITE